MKNEAEKSMKKPYQPAEILVFNYNAQDPMLASNGYDPFFGEEDPLKVQKPHDNSEMNA